MPLRYQSMATIHVGFGWALPYLRSLVQAAPLRQQWHPAPLQLQTLTALDLHVIQMTVLR